MIYFAGGANNDSDGWNYIERWRKIFGEERLDAFERIDQTAGKAGDVYYTVKYSQDSWFKRIEGDVPVVTAPHPMIPIVSSYKIIVERAGDKTEPATSDVYGRFARYIVVNFPNACGAPQLNLMGYSYGSVLMSHVALRLADVNMTVDNLILVGCPIPDKSQLFAELSTNPYIKRVIRHDIGGDLLSNPESRFQFLLGGLQNSSDDGPHFDLARPDNPATTDIDEGAQADKQIRLLAKWLYALGVR